MDEQTEQRIIDKLNGQLSDADTELLNRWLQEDEILRTEFEKMRQVHRYLAILKEDFAPDVAYRLAWVKSHKQRRRIIRHWRAYAAVGVLLFCLGGSWWLKSQQEKQPSDFGEYAHSGETTKKQAYFVLADGEQIFVPSDIKDTVLTREDRVMIRIDTGCILHYKNQVADAKVTQKLVVPNGGEYRLMLEDGSVVWLNSASELEFPAAFDGKERRVRLKGEGYFKIKRDTLRPFRVETDKVMVKVLGTEFNLAAYADETESSTTLVKGVVEVFTYPGKPVRLQPGQQLLSDGKRMIVQEVDVASIISWRDGKFSFQDATLQEIMQQVCRWYDVKYIFAQENLKDIRFSGAIQKFRPLRDLIGMIEATAPVRFMVKGEEVMITGK